ncbi:DedA family protein [Pendulispora rubella]|uniref:DedA family protein n=1 Tax=Pendulispora rubella TaxID=2741070 RepID=A0ABZ2LBT2_9BACT
MLHDLVTRHGLLIVFVNVLAAAIGVPVPAMPTLVLFGAMVSLHPEMMGRQLGSVVVLSVLGALIGDTAWYIAGRRLGARALRTLCRLSLSRDSCVRKTEHFFGRWGVRVLTVSRFIPGLSLVSVPMAGAMRTRYRTFVRYDALGALLWTACALFVGVMFSNQVDWLFEGASRLGRGALAILVGLLALYMTGRWMRRRALIRQLTTARIEVDELAPLLDSDTAPVIFDVHKRWSEIPSAGRDLGDAVLEAGPRGRLIAVFQEIDRAAQKERLVIERFEPSTGWSAPETLEEVSGMGLAASKAAIFADGGAIVTWAHRESDAPLVFRRFVPGTGWAAIQTSDARYDDSMRLISDGQRGGLLLSYALTGPSGDQSRAPYTITSRTLGPQGIGPAQTVATDATYPGTSVAVGTNGAAVLAWQGKDKVRPGKNAKALRSLQWQQLASS